MQDVDLDHLLLAGVGEEDRSAPPKRWRAALVVALATAALLGMAAAGVQALRAEAAARPVVRALPAGTSVVVPPTAAPPSTPAAAAPVQAPAPPPAEPEVRTGTDTGRLVGMRDEGGVPVLLLDVVQVLTGPEAAAAAAADGVALTGPTYVDDDDPTLLELAVADDVQVRARPGTLPDVPRTLDDLRAFLAGPLSQSVLFDLEYDAAGLVAVVQER